MLLFDADDSVLSDLSCFWPTDYQISTNTLRAAICFRWRLRFRSTDHIELQKGKGDNWIAVCAIAPNVLEIARQFYSHGRRLARERGRADRDWMG